MLGLGAVFASVLAGWALPCIDVYANGDERVALVDAAALIVVNTPATREAPSLGVEFRSYTDATPTAPGRLAARSWTFSDELFVSLPIQGSA